MCWCYKHKFLRCYLHKGKLNIQDHQGKNTSSIYVFRFHPYLGFLQFVVIIVCLLRCLLTHVFISWTGPVLSKEQLIPLFSEALVLIPPSALLQFLLRTSNVSVPVVLAVWNSVMTVSVDFLRLRRTAPQPRSDEFAYSV